MPYGVTDGRKAVTTAGTAEQIGVASKHVAQVNIQAETNNTGIMAVGASAVVAAEGSQRGTMLLSGESMTLFDVDMGDIYIDATVSTDGVTFTYKE